jgi:hypothetical protein
MYTMCNPCPCNIKGQGRPPPHLRWGILNPHNLHTSKSDTTKENIGYYAPAARTSLNSCVFLHSSIHTHISIFRSLHLTCLISPEETQDPHLWTPVVLNSVYPVERYRQHGSTILDDSFIAGVLKMYVSGFTTWGTTHAGLNSWVWPI